MDINQNSGAVSLCFTRQFREEHTADPVEFQIFLFLSIVTDVDQIMIKLVLLTSVSERLRRAHMNGKAEYRLDSIVGPWYVVDVGFGD